MAGGEDSTLDRRCDDHCNLLQADDGHAKRRLKRMCGQDLTQDLKENAVFELLVIEVWPAGPRSTLVACRRVTVTRHDASYSGAYRFHHPSNGRTEE